MNRDYVPIGKLSVQPPPFEFGPPGTVYTSKPDEDRRLVALQKALSVLSDRPTEEVLQAAHWIATGEITFEEGDNDEDED